MITDPAYNADLGLLQTHLHVLERHGFNRAEKVLPEPRLQPLTATGAPQGLKPGRF
jgi:hypothetical protein